MEPIHNQLKHDVVFLLSYTVQFTHVKCLKKPNLFYFYNNFTNSHFVRDPQSQSHTFRVDITDCFTLLIPICHKDRNLIFISNILANIYTIVSVGILLVYYVIFTNPHLL
jgi:hypothetical protein